MKKKVCLLVSVMVSMIAVAAISGCSCASTTDILKQINAENVYKYVTLVVPDETDEDTFSDSAEEDGAENGEDESANDSDADGADECGDSGETLGEEAEDTEEDAEGSNLSGDEAQTEGEVQDDAPVNDSSGDLDLDISVAHFAALFHSAPNEAGPQDVVPSHRPSSSGTSSNTASGGSAGSSSSGAASSNTTGNSTCDAAGNSGANNDSYYDWISESINNGNYTTYSYGTPIAAPEPIPAGPDTVNGTYTYVCYVVYDMLDEINARRRANGCPDASWAYEWEEKALVRVRKLAPNPGDTMWQNFSHASNSYWGGCPADEMVGSSECIASGFWSNDASRIDQQYADSPLHNASLHNDGTFPLTKVCSVNCDVYIDGVYYCSFNATITD